MRILGYITAIASFIIGTVILLAYIYTDDLVWTWYGLNFIVLAGVVNICVLIGLGVHSYSNKNYKENSTAAFIIILNIPVVFVYFSIVLVHADKLKVYFKNSTGKEIEQLEVYRNGERVHFVSHLDTGETWRLKVDSDETGGYSLRYMIDGALQEEPAIFNCNTDNMIMGKIGNYLLGQDSGICLEAEMYD